jgi:phasin family protein
MRDIMASKKKSAPKAKAGKASPAAQKSAAPKSAAAPSPFGGVGVWPGAGFTSPPTPKSMESMMSKSQSQFDNMSKDANAYVKEGVEAFVKSGKICAERMQDIMQTCMSICQEAGEKNAEAVKTLMACKTINEVADTQSKLAQQNFDEMMQALTKMTEMTIKLTREAMEPINDQMGKAIKKATDSMAA